jgi:hypothetical protein
VKCPLCEGESHAAMVAGVPVRLCKDIRCRCLFGRMGRLAQLVLWLHSMFVPQDGFYFFIYDDKKTSYPGAFWEWFSGIFRGTP